MAPHLDRHALVDPPPRLLVSIDTEEDQWGPGDSRWTAENIQSLPRAHRVFRACGVRPTYFTSYRVATDSRAAAVLRGIIEEDGTELGAHLHPWNTPPVKGTGEGRDSMLRNLPDALQEQKLRTLTDTLRDVFSVTPRSFRAGRLGLGPGTVRALVRCGYRVDSSVAPTLDWRSLDDGPDYSDAPGHPYRLAPGGDVSVPARDGPLLEIPLSAGYTRPRSGLPARLHRRLEGIRLGGRPLSGALSRSGLIRKVVMSPELDGVEDMLSLARALLRQGHPHVHLVFHSSSLLPEATPFTRTDADVTKLLDTVERFVTELREAADVTPATVGEFADCFDHSTSAA